MIFMLWDSNQLLQIFKLTKKENIAEKGSCLLYQCLQMECAHAKDIFVFWINLYYQWIQLAEAKFEEI